MIAKAILAAAMSVGVLLGVAQIQQPGDTERMAIAYHVAPEKRVHQSFGVRSERNAIGSLHASSINVDGTRVLQISGWYDGKVDLAGAHDNRTAVAYTGKGTLPVPITVTKLRRAKNTDPAWLFVVTIERFYLDQVPSALVLQIGDEKVLFQAGEVDVLRELLK